MEVAEYWRSVQCFRVVMINAVSAQSFRRQDMKKTNFSLKYSRRSAFKEKLLKINSVGDY